MSSKTLTYFKFNNGQAPLYLGGRGQLTLEYRLQSTTGDVSYLINTLIIEVGYLGTYKASIVFGSKEVLESLP